MDSDRTVTEISEDEEHLDPAFGNREEEKQMTDHLMPYIRKTFDTLT
jgi:hypothetical protein